MKKLLAVSILTLCFLAPDSYASASNCDTLAQQAYSAMIEYQITGEFEPELKESLVKSIKKVDRVINNWDKKAEATKYAWKVLDNCNAK
jgi:hypothetical protein